MIMPVRAVVVDDEPQDLLLIGTALTAAGIPAASHWYDRQEFNIDNRLQPPQPEEGYEHIRLLISDLNLEEVPPTRDLAAVIGPVVDAIRKLVAKKSGPYILIFWTGTAHTVDSIREMLPSRLEAIGVPQPFAIEGISKEGLLTFDSTTSGPLIGMFKQAQESAPRLKIKIGEILAKHGMLNMLTQWEARASIAASGSTNGIFDAARVDDPRDLSASLTRIAALISREAVGLDLAKPDPAKAFDAAMIDLLVDHFGRSVSNDDYRKLAELSLGTAIGARTTPTSGDKTLATLNSRFQLDFNTKGVLFRHRGAVISLGSAQKHEPKLAIDPILFMWDDFFLKPQKDEPSRQKKLARGLTDRILAQFDDNPSIKADITAAVNKLRAETKRSLKDRYETFKQQRACIEAKVEWVLVEIGADCDHAQGKTRTLRFVLGAKYRPSFNEYVRNPEGLYRNGAIRNLGPFLDSEGQFSLLLSLKRFVTWQLIDGGKDPEIPVLFRLRKSVVDELLHKYASWSSRAGIIEFAIGE